MECILTYIEAQRGDMEEPGPWRGYELDVTFLGVGMRRTGDTANSANTSKSFYRSTTTNQPSPTRHSSKHVSQGIKKQNNKHKAKTCLKRNGINYSRKTKASIRVLVPQNKTLLLILVFWGSRSKGTQGKTVQHLVSVLEMETHR